MKEKTNFDKAIKILSCCIGSLIFIIIVLIVIDRASNKDNSLFSKQNESTGSETSKLVSRDINDVISGNVEINIPKEMLELSGEEYDYKLTDEQKKNGFTDVKKNADGSATFTMKNSDYKKFIADLKEETKKSFDEMPKNFDKIKKVTYNNDFSEIIIYAEKDKFNDFIASACGLSSILYQMYDIDASGKCNILAKDYQTNETFYNTVFPNN